MTRYIVGGCVAVAIVIVIAALYPNRSDQSGLDQVVGTSTPDFSFPLTNGDQLSLRSLRGHSVLLNVWASWCGPCRREMPALQRLAADQTGRLVVVAIDQGEGADVAASYARRFGVQFPVGVDRDQRLGTVLHLAGLPSSFFIDRRGVIRDAVDGEMTYDTMTKKARALQGTN